MKAAARLWGRKLAVRRGQRRPCFIASSWSGSDEWEKPRKPRRDQPQEQGAAATQKTKRTPGTWTSQTVEDAMDRWVEPPRPETVTYSQVVMDESDPEADQTVKGLVEKDTIQAVAAVKAMLRRVSSDTLVLVLRMAVSRPEGETIATALIREVALVCLARWRLEGPHRPPVTALVDLITLFEGVEGISPVVGAALLRLTHLLARVDSGEVDQVPIDIVLGSFARCRLAGMRLPPGLFYKRFNTLSFDDLCAVPPRRLIALYPPRSSVDAVLLASLVHSHPHIDCDLLLRVADHHVASGTIHWKHLTEMVVGMCGNFIAHRLFTPGRAEAYQMHVTNHLHNRKGALSKSDVQTLARFLVALIRRMSCVLTPGLAEAVQEVVQEHLLLNTPDLAEVVSTMLGCRAIAFRPEHAAYLAEVAPQLTVPRLCNIAGAIQESGAVKTSTEASGVLSTLVDFARQGFPALPPHLSLRSVWLAMYKGIRGEASHPLVHAALLDLRERGELQCGPNPPFFLNDLALALKGLDSEKVNLALLNDLQNLFSVHIAALRPQRLVVVLDFFSDVIRKGGSLTLALAGKGGSVLRSASPDLLLDAFHHLKKTSLRMMLAESLKKHEVVKAARDWPVRRSTLEVLDIFAAFGLCCESFLNATIARDPSRLSPFKEAACSLFSRCSSLPNPLLTTLLEWSQDGANASPYLFLALLRHAPHNYPGTLETQRRLVPTLPSLPPQLLLEVLKAVGDFPKAMSEELWNSAAPSLSHALEWMDVAEVVELIEVVPSSAQPELLDRAADELLWRGIPCCTPTQLCRIAAGYARHTNYPLPATLLWCLAEESAHKVTEFECSDVVAMLSALVELCPPSPSLTAFVEAVLRTLVPETIPPSLLPSLIHSLRALEEDGVAPTSPLVTDLAGEAIRHLKGYTPESLALLSSAIPHTFLLPHLRPPVPPAVGVDIKWAYGDSYPYPVDPPSDASPLQLARAAHLGISPPPQHPPLAATRTSLMAYLTTLLLTDLPPYPHLDRVPAPHLPTLMKGYARMGRPIGEALGVFLDTTVTSTAAFKVVGEAVAPALARGEVGLDDAVAALARTLESGGPPPPEVVECSLRSILSHPSRLPCLDPFVAGGLELLVGSVPSDLAKKAGDLGYPVSSGTAADLLLQDLEV